MIKPKQYLAVFQAILGAARTSAYYAVALFIGVELSFLMHKEREQQEYDK